MVSYTMNFPVVVSQWLFIRHMVIFIVHSITVDVLDIYNLSAIRPSFIIPTNTMMVGAETGLVGLTLGVGQTGQVLLLLLLLMVFLIGIPVYLWFWRNYLKRVVAFYGGKVQVCGCAFQPMVVDVDLGLVISLTHCILSSTSYPDIKYIPSQEYINKAYERVSLRVSDAGRKMSERVRT